MIDKRWWANLNRDISIDCLFIEDFILETDGTVTIIRLGNSFIEKVVKNAARYDLSDCRLTFSDHSEEYWLDTNPCGSHSSFTILDDDVYNIVNYQCSSFGAAVSYIDFEP